jgi:nucleotide-binding universal stress UspA family protein
VAAIPGTGARPLADTAFRPTPRAEVALDPLIPSTAAVRWAVREAVRWKVDLLIAVLGDHDRDGRDAVAMAQATGPNLRMTVMSWSTPDTAAKLAATADSALLVVAGPTPEIDELVMRAYCPIAVVPAEHPSMSLLRRPRDPRPVVVGAGAATEPEVLAFAFAEAAGRRAGLLAVRAWSAPLIDLGLTLSDRLDRWDEADEQSREDLTQQLSVCRLAYPEVAVEQLVVNQRCADLLAEVSPRARLLVLGRSARGALLNGLAVSPAITLARRVPCPVIIVPPSGQVRGSWWPRRRVGLADLSG